MPTFSGSGTLLNEEGEIGRVDFEIRYEGPVQHAVLRMGGVDLVEGLGPNVTGQLGSPDGSVDFWELHQSGRVVTLAFDGGGSWKCSVDATGFARGASDLILPPDEYA